MNCVLFAEMDQVFKKYNLLEKRTGKAREKWNHESVTRFVIT